MDSERPERPIARASFAEDRDARRCPAPGLRRRARRRWPAPTSSPSAPPSRRDCASGGWASGASPSPSIAVPRMLPATGMGCARRRPAAAGTGAQRVSARRLRRAADRRRRGSSRGELIAGAEGYEPDLAGRLPAHCAPAAVIGFDIVRDGDGEFLVLEDNLRTPSGIAYALAARDAIVHALPPGLPVPGRSTRSCSSCWPASCGAAGPPGEPDAGGRPHRRARQRRPLRARADRSPARAPAHHPGRPGARRKRARPAHRRWRRAGQRRLPPHR